MSAYNLVFWQNIPSPHQMPVLRELAKMGHQLTLVVDQMELEERKNMGWKIPDHTGVNLLESKTVDIEGFIADQDKDTVNISSGIRGCASGPAVMQDCKKYRRRLGFIAEPGDPRGIMSIPRRLLYVKDALLFRQYIDFALAMGQTGVDWYLKSGYPKDKVFPYCYVVDDVSVDDIKDQELPFRICYTGALIHRKAVDLLIKALAIFQNHKIIVDLIGDGPESANLKAMAKELGISDSLVYHGSKSNEDARKIMSKADVFILPSRFDGWGAVVNEALMLGVPVICSSACGASDLFRDNNDIGLVFKSGSSGSLYNALQMMMDRGKPNTEMRNHIKSWSKCISGQSVAEYLTNVLDSVYRGVSKPVAPWRLLV